MRLEIFKIHMQFKISMLEFITPKWYAEHHF